MKVLQINCVYNNGSTGKIAKELHDGLCQRGEDSIVLYGRGEKTKEQPNIIKVCSEMESHIYKMYNMLTGVMYGGCIFATNRILRIISREKPDCVHIQCINGDFVNIYRLVSFLNKHNIKTIITLHAEFMHTGNCGHALECEKWKTGCGKCPRLKKETHTLFFDNTHKSWEKMRTAFSGFEKLIVISVSPWLMGRASDSPILRGKDHRVIYNGLDTNIFHKYTDSLCKQLKDKYKIPHSKKMILHVTSSLSADRNHLKGGYYVLELASRMPDVQFVIAGAYDKNISVPDNVQLLGKISNQQDLARMYSVADLTLLTSKRETFSMVVAESLSCGTPVVGFKAGGPEQIALKKYSEFVEYGDISKLESSVVKMLNNQFDSQKIAELAFNQYSNTTMIEDYIRLYREIIEEKN